MTGAAAVAQPIAGQLLVHATDGVPAAQRLAYWRDGVMRRMVPMAAEGAVTPFRGRMRRILGEGFELIEHASEAVLAVRSAERCRIDGCDDIAIDLMRRCTDARLEHHGTHRTKAGDLYLVDYARPSEMKRGAHCTVGLTLSRRLLREALGTTIEPRAGMRFQSRGLALVLRQHLQATFDEADRMSEAERAAAARAAKDMALALLQAGRADAADAEHFGLGFHRAALRLIDRACADPDLTPERIAVALGCSRASLYRAFAAQGDSVAASIWQARLKRAHAMLSSAEGIARPISEIAALAGFREMPSFTRMFRRRYGATPGEVREATGAGFVASLE